MKNFIWLTSIAFAAYSVWRSTKTQESESRSRHEEYDGYSVTRTSLPNNQEMIRFRGSYDDIMRSLGVLQDEKPPLPEGLEISQLPEYSCGCPHCGKMSMVGENMWRYQELNRTRGLYNNTTTFLAKCKNCNEFMKTTVDHDD